MKTFILALCLTLCGAVCMAQQKDSTKTYKLEVVGDLVDFISQQGPDTAFVEVIRDGRCIDTAEFWTNVWNDRRHSGFDYEVSELGKYTFRVAAPGYKTKYVDFNIEKFHKNEQYRYLPTIYLQKEKQMDEVEVGEVTVTATRLKFYMNGDTLVYDAQAFNMADGSMLDALIKKLPGVEMNSDGQISVNGRQVDELQLNGQELIGQDKELFLQNLPAYMVKNIGVSEQTPKDARGTSKEKTAQKEIVMNVKLKREYAKGWIGNMEAGVGASMYDVEKFKADRFMGRVFMSRFSDRGRLSFFGNANNLNDRRNPGEQGDWTPLQQSTGLLESYFVGMSASKKNTEDTKNYSGTTTFGYSEATDHTTNNGESFLDGGNTFSRSVNSRTSYNYEVKSEHELRYQEYKKPVLGIFKGIYTYLRPQFNYRKFCNNSSNASAILDSDVREQWGRQWVDSIMSPMAGDLLRRYSINRTINRSHGEGHDLNTRCYGDVNFGPRYNDKLSFSLRGSGEYSNQATPDFSHYNLEFSNGNSNADQKLNRYNNNIYKNLKTHIGGGVYYSLDEDDKHTISYRYNLYNYKTESNRSLYQLHYLDGFSDFSHPIGYLPSEVELLSTLDKNNSEYSDTKTHNHQNSLSYGYFNSFKNGMYISFNSSLEHHLQNEDIEYRKASVDTAIDRRLQYFTPGITIYGSNHKRGLHIYASYNISKSMPNVSYLMDIVDNSNPLYIRRGNPNLDNSTYHYYSAMYEDRYKGRFQFSSSISGNVNKNATVMATVYDRATGISTVTPINVNGNWNIDGNAGISIPIDSTQKYVIGYRTRYSYTNSVDYTSTTDTPLRQEVGTNVLGNTLTFDLKFSSDFQIGLKAALDYRNSSSENANFQTINVYDFNYGISLQYRMPWKIQFSSDLTMYSRRGYSDSYMNTNELVLNTRLSRPICKGNFVLSVDAFDLLHNLTNVRYYVNAQGRSEEVTNVIPSYALLRLAYKFKGKNKEKKE